LSEPVFFFLHFFLTLQKLWMFCSTNTFYTEISLFPCFFPPHFFKNKIWKVTKYCHPLLELVRILFYEEDPFLRLLNIRAKMAASVNLSSLIIKFG
jgi:hypothetical protein